ncbi:MAG: CpsD/CapB family tyrosine-protein kinase, partial [Gammaproteobacteria bacterium]
PEPSDGAIPEPDIADSETAALSEQIPSAAPVPIRRGEISSQVRTASIRLAVEAPILPFDQRHSKPAEQYRIIRTKIVQHPARPRLLVVTSPGKGDGKTVSAVNLAAALALKSDVNVLLVDADLRRSSIAELLGLPAEPGLADVLASTCGLEDAIVQVEQLPNLYVLPAGRVPSHPTELLDSPIWLAMSDSMRKDFDFVVIDTPPLGAVADYDLIQTAGDGILFVVRQDHTNRTLCLNALQSIPSEKLMGAIVNCCEDWFLLKTHDYAYYAEPAP